MMKTTGVAVLLLALCGLLAFPRTSRAVDFGVRGGFYSDAEAGFLGAELLTGLTRSWFLNPNFEYVFVDDGDLYTLNLDAHYDFPTRARSPFYLWAGGGPAVIFSDNGFDDETDIGLNLLAGVGFGKEQALRPYVQGKVVISDDTEAVIGLGIRFH
jgi:hypothetical protein